MIAGVFRRSVLGLGVLALGAGVEADRVWGVARWDEGVCTQSTCGR